MKNKEAKGSPPKSVREQAQSYVVQHLEPGERIAALEGQRMHMATQADVIRMEGKINAIDTHLKGTDTRLDGIDTHLKEIDTRLDGVDTRLDGIDTRLDGIDTHLKEIDTRLDGIDTRLDGVDTRLDGIDTRLDEMKKDMDNRFNEVDTRLVGLEGKINVQIAVHEKSEKMMRWVLGLIVTLLVVVIASLIAGPGG